ncbi:MULTISPECIES: MFS transporter [Thermoanaerobacterium]|uniref:Major facilitator superfamily protein n=2 Tax=Thermoanaerobacterium TaxID=28895 RepID=W9E8D8_9THEO|nr:MULTISPECIES: MFS transporter [Thermoanaerobacterium]AFK87368.1 major facilitator superfamily MFS_1 [Thermoanaerobacterium saccharolyticum JW/SL-YS485]ETO37065.1 major facilitator superfamily protein [Thermoanaerobacterium aotearoense SCUT27]
MTIVKTNKTKLFILSLSHMVNDYYMNFIQTLMPFLIAAGLSAGKAGFLVSVFTITSSLIQPIIGYIVDVKNQKWFVYVGTLFMAVLLSLLGIMKNYPLLLIISGIAGIGTATFHPQASAMTTKFSSIEKRNTNQAFFVTLGNIGWALTPLTVVPFVEKYGLSITPIFVIPGLIAFILLFLSLKNNTSSSNVKKEYSPLLITLRTSWKELTKIMIVVALRSLTYYGMLSYLALYLKHKNVSVLLSSKLLFFMLFAGALGGLIGGMLADKYGKKLILTTSLILSSFFFLIFILTTGILSYIMLIIAGTMLLASFSITTILAQSLLSKNAAMASGLALGFGTGIGGLGVGLFGILIDFNGVTSAILLMAFIPILAGLISLSIKTQN